MAVGKIPSTAAPYPFPGVRTARQEDGVTTTVTLTAQQIADETTATLERAERVLPVAVEAINRYAPQAPTAIKNEATMRLCGYILGSDYGVVTTEAIGPRSVTYPLDHAAFFRRSGAKALLSPYKVRRAGKI